MSKIININDPRVYIISNTKDLCITPGCKNNAEWFIEGYEETGVGRCNECLEKMTKEGDTQ